MTKKTPDVDRMVVPSPAKSASAKRWGTIKMLIANPPGQAQVQCRIDIAHQSMELLVARRVPLGDKTREAVDCTEQVETCHTRCVENLHEDSRRDGL